MTMRKANSGKVLVGAVIVFTMICGALVTGLTVTSSVGGGYEIGVAPASAAENAPTWGKVLIAGGRYNGDSSTELYDAATNSFAPPSDTAAMNTARVGATATLLASGKVLIAGGESCNPGSCIVLSSTELYDPATNSFAAAADTAVMNTARADATATLLASGKMLIAGGYSVDGYPTLTELYDPATNNFAAAGDTAAMNTGRTDATATLLASGKVLIAGGLGVDGYSTLTELYDPATNSFAAPGDTAAMNTGRADATATLLASGKVLVAGGYMCINSCPALSSTELYDPATNSFAAHSATAFMKTARTDATATLLASGKVLIAGGDNSTGILSSTELYSPASNKFAAPGHTATMNVARGDAVAILLPLPPSGGVTLLPSALDFGTVTIGQSSAASVVTLTNGAGKQIKIKGTAIGADFQVVSTTCSSTLSAGQSCEYQLSFQPRRAGTKNEKFRVTVTGGPQKVQLQGVGVR